MSELADSNISVVNDVFIKQIHFREAGWVTRSHVHTYDHQTLLAAGTVRMRVEGDPIVRVAVAPQILMVKAGLVHEFESLEPDTVLYCIHAIKGGDTIDEAEPLVQGQSNAELRALA